MRISLLTGAEPHYQIGLVSGLVEQDVVIDVIGDNSLMAAPIMTHPQVRFLLLRERLDPWLPLWRKILRVIKYYARLLVYAAGTDSRLFHIQWPYKLVFLDRTIVNLYFKALGKKIVFTAHNVDQDARDETASWSNRLSLRFLYKIVDRIIVHTNKMKADLVRDFCIPDSKISVIPHGLNCALPESSLSREEARQQLNLGPNKRVLLFFGLIARYKGLDCLIRALSRAKEEGETFTLIVAGRLKGDEAYWKEIQELITREKVADQVCSRLEHIPDESVEVYFKAADVLVMPYRNIFQSGVLFVAYRFGLPVIAADVGSLREDILEGKTGLLFKPMDPVELAHVIQAYFETDLYKNLESRRLEIRSYACDRYSWGQIGSLTRNVYADLLQ